ncbi:FkbM family methyltransferase [Blastopirellula sp. JC732]|uniref:FkbM family methyltransferase n=1 Tax=Blastopirellula sediminis TaxID=2894196 RepID=A0A9X1MIB9_9BACT|nr:FkbM family methyltransferase [Blastopirellula sediminis]MCC9609606.1 FkbM family methyltransferase [Blastopirellula sediminis]MCC9627618.1 FkbM family methyltransferase [Blastopirellula sediminis]
MIKALGKLYHGFRTDDSHSTKRGTTSSKYYVKDFRYCGKPVSGVFRYGTIDEGIYQGIFREYRLEEISKKLAGRPSTIVDIGGHIGGFSVIAATLLPQANIQVYEYMPENLRMIQSNLLLNNVQNQVQAYNYAVADRSDQVIPKNNFDNIDVHASKEHRTNTGGICIADKATTSQACENGIPTLAAKEIFGPLDQVDVFKIDCEGSEFKILFSLDETDYHKIQMITGEIHHQDDNYGDSKTNGHLWNGPGLLNYLRHFYKNVEVHAQSDTDWGYMQIFSASDPM